MSYEYQRGVCQEYARSPVQSRLLVAPNYVLDTYKSIIFYTSVPMSKIPDVIALLNAKADEIMAALDFYGFLHPYSGDGSDGNYPPNQFQYNFIINPSLEINYGTGYPNKNFYYGVQPFSPGISTLQANPVNTENPGTPIWNTLAGAQADMDAAYKMIELVWWHYTGPVGSKLSGTTQTLPIGGIPSVTTASFQITSVAIPPDVDTPVSGSIVKIPIPIYADPVYVPTVSGGVTYWQIEWGWSSCLYGSGPFNTFPSPLGGNWIHGDFSGAGGAGGAGGGSGA